MHLWSRAHPCLKRQVQAHRTMGVRGGALPQIVRSRTLGPRFRREGQLRVPRLVSEPAKPNQAEPPPKRGDSVPDVAGGDNPQPGDSTPSLSTDVSMGMASHPEASKPAGPDVQPEPVDAGGAKRASPSQGAAGGDNDGDGNGAEGDSPTSPADELPGRDDPMDENGTGGGGGPNAPDDDDDPSDPGDHESGPDSEYYAPAESADACIVVHYLFRRAG